jgi:uncharacterized membrane protein
VPLGIGSKLAAPGCYVLDNVETDSVTLEEVNSLVRAGLLPATRYLGAAYMCRESDYWTRWALRALLALGGGHLLAGIIFFFAYNWDGLPSFAKFGILETAILISAVLAILVKLDRAAGQVLLIGTSVVTGVLLAVIGQVYQTGADAYELFTAWALLIIPWVLASRSGTHWFVWLVIVNIAFATYGTQVLIPLGTVSGVELACLHGIGVVIALAAIEAAIFAGARWLKVGWLRPVLVLVGLAILFIPAVGFVLRDWNSELVGLLTFLAVIAALMFVYVRVLPDYPVVAIGTGFAALFLMALGWRVLHETTGFNWNSAASIISSLILLVLWCAAVTTATVKALVMARRRLAKGATDG